MGTLILQQQAEAVQALLCSRQQGSCCPLEAAAVGDQQPGAQGESVMLSAFPSLSSTQHVRAAHQLCDLTVGEAYLLAMAAAAAAALVALHAHEPCLLLVC